MHGERLKKLVTFLFLAFEGGAGKKTFLRIGPKNMFWSFWFLVTFGKEVTKIQKYYVTFVYILQGKMGKTEKTPERKSRN